MALVKVGFLGSYNCEFLEWNNSKDLLDLAVALQFGRGGRPARIQALLKSQFKDTLLKNLIDFFFFFTFNLIFFFKRSHLDGLLVIWMWISENIMSVFLPLCCLLVLLLLCHSISNTHYLHIKQIATIQLVIVAFYYRLPARG